MRGNGVILSCSKPSSMVKFVKSMELNGGPLSLSNLLGMPCVAKIFLSFSFVCLHANNVSNAK
jgi:hypothetical protein